MKARDVFLVCATWAAATAAIGWRIGDLEVAFLVSVGSSMVLMLFLGLWHATSLAGAAVTFGTTAVLLFVGALVFAVWSRWLGTAIMMIGGLAFGGLAGWAGIRWGSRRSAPSTKAEAPDDRYLTNDEWSENGWGRGKAFLDLPKYPTSEPIWLGWEFGAINPDTGRDDRK
jgi:hypothetical protein